MNRLLVAAVVVTLSLVAALATALAQDAPAIRWETDLDAATARAAETGRPLMVVFR